MVIFIKIWCLIDLFSVFLHLLMANDYFRFKQFTLWQQHCAMKVGTDGVLLGAWADGGRRILDIGTGTGLVALMMAQRFPESDVTAVEIDGPAAMQASENVVSSPFSDRVFVVHEDIRKYAEISTGNCYDAIVCNPPFFVNSLKNPDAQKALARHNDNLSFCQLFSICFKLLASTGSLSIIAPFEAKSVIEGEAAISGFILQHCVLIKTTIKKLPKRCLMKFVKQSLKSFIQEEVFLQNATSGRSDWYQSLTDDFYLSEEELSDCKGKMS